MNNPHLKVILNITIQDTNANASLMNVISTSELSQTDALAALARVALLVDEGKVI
jgi:hypothetical protein